MKKFAVLVLAAWLVVAFTVPASALENVFGGYWRTRFYTNQNFDGHDRDVDDTGMEDITRLDTRTRIYYTAILNDNLKFVNKFEMNAKFGGQDSATSPNSYGDIGADGLSVRVKNSYVDFSLGGLNAKVGVQGAVLTRGLLFDDDFSGVTVAFKSGGVTIPVIWMKAFDEDSTVNNRDVDYVVVSPSFKAGGLTLNPFGMYVFSDNASTWGPTGAYNDVDIYYAGLDLQADLGPASLWASGIYQGGEVELNGTNNKQDVKAWLAAGGLTLGLGSAADLHGQFVYATGQDTDDEDITQFFVPAGQSYYWSEIMGFGDFDDRVSKNSPADQISNIMFANLGTTIKPTADLKISLDAWWAQLAEDIQVTDPQTNTVSDEKDLGIEANVKVTYTLVEGLDLDLIGAYLFAGDATTMKDKDDADPYEIGTRLSLSF